MSEVMETADDIAKPDELTVLKQRARLMGIEHSNNIGVEALRKKIKDHQEGTKAVEPAVSEVNPLAGAVSEKMSVRQKLIAEQMKLIRVRVTNMDPKKKDLPGEIFTVANEYIGTVRKFVPYGEATDNGYHIPYCIYTFLQSRKFQHLRTHKDKKTNIPRMESSWVKEFALEVLPPLTQEELDDLRRAQLASGSVSSND